MLYYCYYIILQKQIKLKLKFPLFWKSFQTFRFSFPVINFHIQFSSCKVLKRKRTVMFHSMLNHFMGNSQNFLSFVNMKILKYTKSTIFVNNKEMGILALIIYIVTLNI